MYPSAQLCRVQEAFHRSRAESSPLDNVRTIARQAAAAWGVEGRLAEDREQRQANVRAIRISRVETDLLACDELDLASSENPDRARANASPNL